MDVKVFDKKDLNPTQIAFLETYGVNVVFVRLADPEFNPLHWEAQGDWIDLKLAEDLTLKKGDYYEASLGLSAKIPEGYEAHIEPRSSTYKRYHILMANEMGIVDNSYSGNDDVWHFLLYTTEDTQIAKGTRIAQFRLMPNMKTMFWGKPMPKGVKFPHRVPNLIYSNGFVDLTEYDLVIVYTDELGSANRGGVGSTGY